MQSKHRNMAHNKCDILKCTFPDSNNIWNHQNIYCLFRWGYFCYASALWSNAFHSVLHRVHAC